MEEGRMMGGGERRPWIFLLSLFILILAGGAEGATNATDLAALLAVKAALVDPTGSLVSWQGDDPCGAGAWAGVICEQNAQGVGTVTELRLFRMGLQGVLAPEVGNLQNLVTLDVMWNSIAGSLPPSIGNLPVLQLLLLSGNNMTGPLPPELGRLATLIRLQADQNNFTGQIPTTFTNLLAVQHLHLNNNSFSGNIPTGIGSLPNAMHLLVDNNQLTGTIPPDLANSSTLQILQLDNNPLAEQPIPSAFGQVGKFPALIKLSMRGCNLQGIIPPGIGNINHLKFLDLSQNSLSGTIPILSLPNLTSIYLSSNNFSQDIGTLTIGPVPLLQALFLSNNNLSGQADIPSLLHLSRSGPFPVTTLDLQNNDITDIKPGTNVTLWLSGNPRCSGNADFTECMPQSESGFPQPVLDTDANNKTLSDAGGCSTLPCSGQYQYSWAVDSQPCSCKLPITLRLRLKSPGFSVFAPLVSRFERHIADAISQVSGGNLPVPVDQVFVRSYTWQPGPRVQLFLQLFPSGAEFTAGQADALITLFATWKLPDDDLFGPVELVDFLPRVYDAFGTPAGGEEGSKSGLGAGAVGGVVAAAVLGTAVLAGLLGAWYVRKHKGKGKWAAPIRRGLLGGDRSSVQITGVKEFTFQELSDATEGFSDARGIGRGGYGKVYHGELAEEGQVAIKRAQEGSLQGSKEFYTEIELLSRVHHRNLVKLVGYCHDQGEQMLVYEYMEGGTLRDNLSSEPGLDIMTRLRIALGSARGIAYLHNEANPPIFHRDIKATNILLDRKLNAKVADFGLSKLAPAPDQEGSGPGYVSTVVKGTPGYLDPEYFLTHKLTDKSDVYSFGVVLLELITGLHPISHGKNIVREVKTAYDSGNVLHIVDPQMGAYSSEVLQPLVSLAISCCKDDPDKRPSILEVVRDLDDIWRTMPWDVSTDIEASAGLQSKPPRHHSQGSSSDNFNNHTEVLISGTVIDVTPR